MFFFAKPINRAGYLEFNFASATKRTTARLVLPDGTSLAVQSENLPKELRTIPNAQAFFALMQHVSVRTSVLSDGAIKIYLDGRVVGGGPYEIALQKFKAHLESQGNRKIAREIICRFDDICNDPTTFSKDEEELLAIFKDIEPSETRELLDSLLLHIAHSAKSDTDILRDLFSISKIPIPDVEEELVAESSSIDVQQPHWPPTEAIDRRVAEALAELNLQSNEATTSLTTVAASSTAATGNRGEFQSPTGKRMTFSRTES